MLHKNLEELRCAQPFDIEMPKVRFGGENIHLKQDPVVAFFLIQPDAFTLGSVDDLPQSVQSSVQRVIDVDCKAFATWLSKVAHKSTPKEQRANDVDCKAFAAWLSKMAHS